MGFNDISKINTNNKNIGYPSYNAVQINLKKPTANVEQLPVIYDYPEADGQIYYPPVESKPSDTNQNIKRYPSGVEDYDNYTEFDNNGNIVANIEYSKEGDTLVQKLSTKSPDGSTVSKTLKNSANFKSSNIIISDKDGNILLKKDKTYKKINDDNAQTTINGEIYNISGLSGDIIQVEHNGKITTIDLNKMLNPDVKKLKPMTSPDNLPLRETKITDDEKEKLFNRIKSLGGDDLVRLSKSVDHLQFLDDKSIESFFMDSNRTLLLSPKDWENKHLVTLHELGHAITNAGLDKEQKELLSDREPYTTIRNYERENFKNNNNNTFGNELFASKFMFGNSYLAWAVGDKDEEESNLRNETFAECYNNLNNMDIIHYYDEVLPMRTLALFKYLPKTMAEADKLSQI